MAETHINDLINEKITKIKEKNNIFDSGKVVKIKDYTLEVVGLEDVTFFEKVIIMGKGIGYVNAINEHSVIVAVVKEDEPIMIGDIVNATKQPFKAIFSEDALGRITDIFGIDKLTDQPYENFSYIDVEKPNIPIMDRVAVTRPLLTAIAGIDLIYPIGKGQRQLIIGDKKSGKTQIALDAIVNQGKIEENSNKMICIYVAIGKTKKEIRQVYDELKKRYASNYTMILSATNDDKMPILNLIPYVGLSIAEEYMMRGKDVLVVIDDLKRHAEISREISLISNKTPGREAYPSDIFYTHARLLEKGCQHKNGGSITILPIVETKGGDITDYISTNIISITDGQIVLSTKQFLKGQKPAIDYGISVSRIGGAAQGKEMKKLGANIRLKLLNYLETKEVYELANVDEMGEELKKKINEGKMIENALRQNKFEPMSYTEILDRFGELGDVEDED